MFMLRKIIVVWFAVSLGLLSVNANAEAANVTLTNMLQDMRSLQGDFVQTILDKNGKALQKSYGYMSLQRPSQFRWDVKRPVRQLIVTNGMRLWIYDPDLEQVTIRSLVKAAGETPALLLSDKDLSLSKEYDVRSVHKAGSSLQWFYLVPKDQSSMISALKLGFAGKELQQMQIEDHLGHTTLIEFKNIHLNSPISTALFTFKPPKHIDVIDETKH